MVCYFDRDDAVDVRLVHLVFIDKTSTVNGVSPWPMMRCIRVLSYLPEPLMVPYLMQLDVLMFKASTMSAILSTIREE